MGRGGIVACETDAILGRSAALHPLASVERAPRAVRAALSRPRGPAGKRGVGASARQGSPRQGSLRPASAVRRGWGPRPLAAGAGLAAGPPPLPPRLWYAGLVQTRTCSLSRVLAVSRHGGGGTRGGQAAAEAAAPGALRAERQLLGCPRGLGFLPRPRTHRSSGV